MAKKTTSRSKAEPNSDAPDPAAAAPKPRSRARTAKPGSDMSAAQADDRTTDVAQQQSPLSEARSWEDRPSADAGQQPPSYAATQSNAQESSDSFRDTTTSVSMGSEPSEEDIRMRAYHRYLERGGSHGRDFEDWLEAERELREGRSRG